MACLPRPRSIPVPALLRCWCLRGPSWSRALVLCCCRCRCRCRCRRQSLSPVSLCIAAGQTTWPGAATAASWRCLGGVHDGQELLLQLLHLLLQPPPRIAPGCKGLYRGCPSLPTILLKGRLIMNPSSGEAGRLWQCANSKRLESPLLRCLSPAALQQLGEAREPDRAAITNTTPRSSAACNTCSLVSDNSTGSISPAGGT